MLDLMDILKEYHDVFQIITMSLFVSVTSTMIAAFGGLSIGIPLALRDFRGKRALMGVIETLMGLPPVLMGLVVYLLLSRKGPLGHFGLLFTPAAMIIAQSLLVLPIISGLTVSSLSRTGREIEKTCISLGASRAGVLLTIIKEGRMQILTVITAGFGRAISEVGAVMMAGGNIKGFTRVMTTYIAMETGKGNFDKAVIIGIVLLCISFMINSILRRFQGCESQ